MKVASALTTIMAVGASAFKPPSHLGTPIVTNWTDNADAYKISFERLFIGSPKNTEADVLKLFAPTYVQHTDATTYNFTGFVAHIRSIRETASIKIEVNQFLRDGDQIAERHVVNQTSKDGTKASIAVLFFGQVGCDGRIESAVESTRVL